MVFHLDGGCYVSYSPRRRGFLLFWRISHEKTGQTYV